MKASYLTSFVVILVVARMIIAGSAVNGVLRHEVYKIACAATVTV